MPSLPHAPIPAKSDKTIAHVNNFRHHKKDQRRFAPTLFTSSECFIHIIGIRTGGNRDVSLQNSDWSQAARPHSRHAADRSPDRLFRDQPDDATRDAGLATYSI